MSVLLPLSDIPGFVLEPGDRVSFVNIHTQATVQDVLIGGESGGYTSTAGGVLPRRVLSIDLSLPAVRDRLGRALFQKLFPEAEQPLENPMYVGLSRWCMTTPGYTFEDREFQGWEGDSPEAPLLALADLCRQVFGEKP